jgi:hypothetical protein
MVSFFDDVYAEMPPHLKEQRDALLASLQRRLKTQGEGRTPQA